MESMSTQDRRRHNASTFIGRLPIELLASIFLIIIEKLWSGWPERKAYTGVETLRQVCSLWNGLVSTTPSLWAFASASWPRRKVLRALALSRDNPISIEDRGSWGRTKDFTSLLLPHAWRWKVACIEMPKNQVDCDIHQYLHFGHLEELWIDNEGRESDACPSFERSRLPVLRCLTLVEKSIPWDSPLISGLEFLEIWLFSSLDLSARDLLAVFERNPALEELHHFSVSFVSPVESAMSLEGPRIAMERLHFLELHSPYNVTHTIFDRVKFPALREGKIVLWTAEPNSPMFVTTPLTETFYHIISDLFPGAFIIAFHKSASQLAFQSSSREITIDLHMVFDEANLCQEVGNLLGKHKEQIQRSTVTTVDCTAEEWNAIDSAMAVRGIVVQIPESGSPPYSEGLLAALSSLTPQSTETEAAPRFFLPKLDTIRTYYFRGTQATELSNLHEVLRLRYPVPSSICSNTLSEEITRLEVLELHGSPQPPDDIFASFDGILGAGTACRGEDWVDVPCTEF